MQLEDNGVLKILKADKGYKLYSVISNQYYDEVYLGIYDSEENYREIQVELIEGKQSIATLEDLKKARIQMSKDNLVKYLEDNPLLSKVKYENGRYYSITATKQQQLTSTLLMYLGYTQAGIPYDLKWNDTGSVCESWTYEELFRLSMEIDSYVKKLVEVQQLIEVAIKQAESSEEVENIDVSYSKENMEKYINI